MAKHVDNTEAALAFVSLQMDVATELQEEYAEFVQRRKGNRDMLKNFKDQGLLSDEQLLTFEEIYPSRERADAETRVALLEEQLEKARERAAKDATPEPDESAAEFANA